MKPTLLLLAAGMGSRYGGLKQLDGLGPHGETIMDYSIYDAIQAGFGKIVFVIRKDFEEQFREKRALQIRRPYPGRTRLPRHRRPSRSGSQCQRAVRSPGEPTMPC